MGWGTDFKADVYLNRQTFSSKFEVEDKIEELSQSIEDNKSILKMYASSTPSAIVPDDLKEDTIGWLNNEINMIFDTLQEEIVERYNLNLYLEFLEENSTESKKETFDVEEL